MDEDGQQSEYVAHWVRQIVTFISPTHVVEVSISLVKIQTSLVLRYVGKLVRKNDSAEDCYVCAQQ